jgi:ribonucleoside-diphosphate reductase beta chain
MALFQGTRTSYKPFDYPWAFEFFEHQNKLHWIPAEVSLQADIQQWRSKLTAEEKHLLEQVQKFLASADTDVAGVYCDKYIPNFPTPEVRSALLAIANIEAIHQQSYALTIDTLGMSESSYSEFIDIPEMMEKHQFITKKRTESLPTGSKMLLDIAICSGFGEGMQLFSAFAILLSFAKRGLMTGMGQLTTFISRDEDLHCQFMIKIFNTMKEESPEFWTPELRGYIVQAAFDAVRLEEHFIDLAFNLGPVDGLNKEELKDYIRYVTNKRLQEMGLSPVFSDLLSNPLPWMDEMLAAQEHANFFETRSTSYSKSNLSGTWEECWT